MSKKHILIVDDESGIRSILVELLTGAGYRVSEASSPSSALRLVTADRPDLVITDLQMDDADGFELIDALHATTPKLPVILLTGVMFDPDEIQKTLANRIACYIEKTRPLDFILESVRHHIGG